MTQTQAASTVQVVRDGQIEERLVYTCSVITVLL